MHLLNQLKRTYYGDLYFFTLKTLSKNSIDKPMNISTLFKDYPFKYRRDYGDAMGDTPYLDHILGVLNSMKKNGHINYTDYSDKNECESFLWTPGINIDAEITAEGLSYYRQNKRKMDMFLAILAIIIAAIGVYYTYRSFINEK